MVTIREAVARLMSTDHFREAFTATEARRRALARLGGDEPDKQLHRETRGMPHLDGFLQDVRYSVRTLSHSPAATIASVGTLAIGIGATTAIFSTVNATLLRPLPYPAAEQLVDVHTRYVDGRVTAGLVATSEIVTLNNLPGVTAADSLKYAVVDGTWLRDDGSLMGCLAPVLQATRVDPLQAIRGD